MPRNISFAMTTPQFRARTKTVTRRPGWRLAKAGDVLMAVEKGQGLKKGDKVERLGLIRVASAGREPLDAITGDDVAREGFPGTAAAEFVGMFCKHNKKCRPGTIITRIEFEYVDLSENGNRRGDSRGGGFSLDGI